MSTTIGKIVFSIWDQGCDRDLGPCAADLRASQNPTYATNDDSR